MRSYECDVNLSSNQSWLFCVAHDGFVCCLIVFNNQNHCIAERRKQSLRLARYRNSLFHTRSSFIRQNLRIQNCKEAYFATMQKFCLAGGDRFARDYSKDSLRVPVPWRLPPGRYALWETLLDRCMHWWHQEELFDEECCCILDLSFSCPPEECSSPADP
jgi:hypothetical protein